MGFRLAPLFFLFFLLANPARAQIGNGTGTCEELKPQPTAIEISATVAEPFYDLSLSGDDVNKNGQSTSQRWLEEHNMQGIWTVNDLRTEGYASGAWGVAYGMGLKAVPYDMYGAIFCPYFTQVEINLMFRTLIVIPKEFKEKPCTFNVINEHELKHYNANKKAVEYYVGRLKKDMPSIIAQVESEYVSRSQVQDRFKDMKQAISDAVQAYFNEAMSQKSNELNIVIDSPQEYEIRGIMKRDCKEN
jgi:hypothetical protein